MTAMLFWLRFRKRPANVQSRGAIVAACLPFDVPDMRVGPVVRRRLLHPLGDRLGSGVAEVAVGHEASPSRERRQPQGAELRHRDRARCLCLGAELCVVGGQVVLGGHAPNSRNREAQVEMTPSRVVAQWPPQWPLGGPLGELTQAFLMLEGTGRVRPEGAAIPLLPLSLIHI